MTNFKSIKNIIFDLGAVIINIDFNKTFEAFSQLSNLSVKEVAKRYQASTFFVEFEKGIIGNHLFIQHIRRVLELPESVADASIIQAWNRLLLTIPKARVERIQSLSTTYRLFLLSNTNPVHISEVHHILYRDTGINRLEELFEKTWYSYDLGLIKPHVAIYEKVLSDTSLKAEETVFLDDNADNIQGALDAGIVALRVHEDMDMIELLKHA